MQKQKSTLPIYWPLVIEGGASSARASVCLYCPLGGGGETNFETESAVLCYCWLLARSVRLGVDVGEMRGSACRDVEEEGEWREALGEHRGITGGG